MPLHEEWQMIFGKKYCPAWVYDCVVAQVVNDYILYGVDLLQPCKKFSTGLSTVYEEVSLEELVRAAELVIQFLHEHRVNEESVDFMSSFAFFRFYYSSKNKRRKFGGLVKSDIADGEREYTGNETLKSLKAYFCEKRSQLHIAGSPGWSLATQTEVPELSDIAKDSSFKANPMDYFQSIK